MIDPGDADAVAAKTLDRNDPWVPGGTVEARLHVLGGRGHGDHAPCGLRRGSHPDQAGGGRGGLHQGQGRPGAMGAVSPGLGGGVATGDDRSRPARSWRSIARQFGLWWLNACRIVYVVDEPGPIRRTGSPTGRCPITPGRVRRGSSSNGIGRAERSGTTSWPSPARTESWPGSDTRTCGESRSDSGGSRRRRC